MGPGSSRSKRTVAGAGTVPYSVGLPVTSLSFRAIVGLSIGSKQSLKRVEPLRPETFVITQPGFRLRQPCRLQPAIMGAACNTAAYQTRLLQNLQVFRGAGERHGKGCGKFAHAALALGQSAQHDTSRRIGKGVKDGIQIRGIMLNH